MTCLGSKKRYQPPSKEEDKPTPDNTSQKKNFEVVWVVNSGAADANMENAEEYPPFVMHVVEVHHLLLKPQLFKEKIYMKIESLLSMGLTRDRWK